VRHHGVGADLAAQLAERCRSSLPGASRVLAVVTAELVDVETAGAAVAAATPVKDRPVTTRATVVVRRGFLRRFS